MEVKKKKVICWLIYIFCISPHTSTAFNGYVIIIKLVPKLGDKTNWKLINFQIIECELEQKYIVIDK